MYKPIVARTLQNVDAHLERRMHSLAYEHATKRLCTNERSHVYNGVYPYP